MSPEWETDSRNYYSRTNYLCHASGARGREQCDDDLRRLGNDPIVQLGNSLWKGCHHHPSPPTSPRHHQFDPYPDLESPSTQVYPLESGLMAEGGRMLHFARGRGECGIIITQVDTVAIKIFKPEHIMEIDDDNERSNSG